MARRRIAVYFDPQANPPVQMDPMVLGREEMEWYAENDSEERETEAFTARNFVVVKFEDQADLPPEDFGGSELAGLLPEGGSTIDPDVVFHPHFGAVQSGGVSELSRRAQELDPEYAAPNLISYRNIEVPDEHQGDRLVSQLRKLPVVDLAYLHPGPVLPPQVDIMVNPEGLNQGYLQPAPDGVDAVHAWTVAGGDGEGQQLADIEWGWNQKHQDLAGHVFTDVNTGHYQKRRHGTRVLGVIASRDNKFDCVGITPNLSSLVTVSQWYDASTYFTDLAIYQALFEMYVGDVLLIEAQTDMYGHKDVPLEAEPGVFDMVRLATALGVVVVAAAGNGGVDLDKVQDDNNDYIFDAAFRDSQAIIVGCAQRDSNNQWGRSGYSCHGTRVNCFAWGEGVVTLDSDYWGNSTTGTINNFEGTSAASAIVAGAALSIQGVAQKKLGNRLAPMNVRDLLSDTGLNTLSQDPVKDRVGVMPDLKQILAAI